MLFLSYIWLEFLGGRVRLCDRQCLLTYHVWLQDGREVAYLERKSCSLGSTSIPSALDERISVPATERDDKLKSLAGRSLADDTHRYVLLFESCFIDSFSSPTASILQLGAAQSFFYPKKSEHMI